MDMQSQYLYAAKEMRPDKPEDGQAVQLSSPGCHKCSIVVQKHTRGTAGCALQKLQMQRRQASLSWLPGVSHMVLYIYIDTYHQTTFVARIFYLPESCLTS